MFRTIFKVFLHSIGNIQSNVLVRLYEQNVWCLVVSQFSSQHEPVIAIKCEEFLQVKLIMLQEVE